MNLRIFSAEFSPNNGACCTFNAGLNSSGHKVALNESLRAVASYSLQFTMYINVYEKLKSNGFLSNMGGIVFKGETKKRPKYGIHFCFLHFSQITLSFFLLNSR